MRFPYFLCCITIALISGCSAGSDATQPDTAPASGTVTYKGQPVVQAVVVFNPQTHKFAASAVTDQEGKFELMAFPPEAGAVPGTYTVTILKSSQEDVYQDQGKKPTMAKSVLLIPARYSNPMQSGLTQEIVAEGNTSITFDLVD